jgi:hypothetical protein
MCAVLGMRSHSSRATRHARDSSRSSPSMVSISRTPGSLKCLRFRREGAAARRQASPLTAIWTLVDIVSPRAEEPLCRTYELLLLCYGAQNTCADWRVNRVKVRDDRGMAMSSVPTFLVEVARLVG